MLKIKIRNRLFKVFEPVLAHEARFESHVRGLPSRLTFSAVDFSGDVSLGNRVEAWLDDSLFFVGHLFTIRRSSDDCTDFVAYDSLRYFKNKETLIHNQGTAADLLLRICTDYSLPSAAICETPYTLPPRVEYNSTLFDIMENALDETFSATGNRYYIHCSNGLLYLSPDYDLKTGIVLDSRDISDAYFQESIDKDVYTRIRLTSFNRSLKRYTVTSATSDNASLYGVLQYARTVDDDVCADSAAKHLLSAKSSPAVTTVIECPKGNIKIRGGYRIGLAAGIGGKFVSGEYTVESCAHSFGGGVHKMKLSLKQIHN